ncbi:MAG: 16S rRNA (cytosine(967)-C(5))-methyltransferase, partial [Pseudomonadota bacterium]
QRVRETLDRLGYSGARLAAVDAASVPQWWRGEPFDAILLDAPCSGLGVVRRHPDIKILRRAADIDRLVTLQAELLDALWPLLKPGGRLLYATCSIVRRENDIQAQAFQNRTPDLEILPIKLPVGRPSGPGWQILPGEMGCDGFYYALMRRQISPVNP